MWIIRLAFSEETNKPYEHYIPYYIWDADPDSDIFNEVYSPHKATNFKTKAQAKEWLDANTDMQEYAQIVRVTEAASAYDNWVKEGTVRRQLRKPKSSLAYARTTEDKYGILDWWLRYYKEYTTNGEPTIKQSDYRTWPPLYMEFEYLHGLEAYRSLSDEGYDSNLRFTCCIKTYKHGYDYTKFKEELDLVLGHCTYKNEDGAHVIRVFDHYLSEGGNSVSLVLNTDGTANVAGRFGDGNKFKTLEAAFEYLCEFRYYEVYHPSLGKSDNDCEEDLDTE